VITQRRALGMLFTALAAILLAGAAAAINGAGHDARRWIVGVASLALAFWLGSLALAALRSGR
jgi:hypothetical protein